MLHILRIFFTALILFCSISCVSDMGRVKHPYYSIGHPRSTNPIHIKIDRNFSTIEKEKIAKAFVSWEKASSNIIKFLPEWDQPRPIAFLHMHLPVKKDAGIFLWHLPKTKEQLGSRLEEFKNYGGVTIYGPDENSIDIIIFEEIYNEQFYSVVTHEMGHVLMLTHIPGKFAMMHPSALAECITEYDEMQLCELYGCKFLPECHIEPPGTFKE